MFPPARRRDDAVRARHWDRDARRARDGVEDVLRLQGALVRRAAEHARVPGVPRAAGRAPGAEPEGDRARDHRRARAPLRDAGAYEVRPQELPVSGPAEGLSDLAVRPAALGD